MVLGAEGAVDPAISGPARRRAWIAGLAVVAFSMAIFAIVRSGEPFEPPAGVSRALASALLLATPGVVGALGAATGRRTVVLAAGIVCLLQSGVSFSYVTLFYIVPGVVFLRAATDGRASGAGRLGPLGIVAAVVVGVPLAVLVVFSVGILGIVAVALVAGLAAASRDRPPPKVSASALVRGSAVLVLLIGAWFVSFALAETACWVGRSNDDGTIAWQRVPATNTLSLGPEDVVAQCEGGTLTGIGSVATAGLLVAACGAAGLPWRRHGRQPGLRVGA